MPDPARYAVHKLIVAARRLQETAKDLKDLAQARSIAEALRVTGGLPDLHDAFDEARGRGQKWHEALTASLDRLEAHGMREARTKVWKSRRLTPCGLRHDVLALTRKPS